MLRAMSEFQHGFGVGLVCGVAFVAVFFLIWL